MNNSFPSVDIIIPTCNGGDRFAALLDELDNQDYGGSLGVILVDSGSEDDTLKIASWHECVSVVKISKEEFSHSYARNLGAEYSKADILLFMTQDAIPIGRDWVISMILPLNNGYAAVSCVESTEKCPDLFYRISSKCYQKDMGIANADKECCYCEGMAKDEFRKNCILNDIACAIKRETFSQYKYEGDYAEDLMLGKKLVLDGYKLLILGNTFVDHYHNRPAEYFLKRQYVETRAVNKIMDNESRKLPSSQVLWLIRQTNYCVEATIKILSFLEKTKTIAGKRLYLFLFRQLLKILERTRTACQTKEWISPNPMSDLRGFLKYEVEPVLYMYEDCANFREIKECIWKQTKLLFGVYLANTEDEMDFCKDYYNGI